MVIAVKLENEGGGWGGRWGMGKVVGVRMEEGKADCGGGGK